VRPSYPAPSRTCAWEPTTTSAPAADSADASSRCSSVGSRRVPRRSAGTPRRRRLTRPQPKPRVSAGRDHGPTPPRAMRVRPAGRRPSGPGRRSRPERQPGCRAHRSPRARTPARRRRRSHNRQRSLRHRGESVGQPVGAVVDGVVVGHRDDVDSRCGQSVEGSGPTRKVYVFGSGAPRSVTAVSRLTTVI
jgi:hypothetical protein